MNKKEVQFYANYQVNTDCWAESYREKIAKFDPKLAQMMGEREKEHNRRLMEIVDYCKTKTEG